MALGQAASAAATSSTIAWMTAMSTSSETRSRCCEAALSQAAAAITSSPLDFRQRAARLAGLAGSARAARAAIRWMRAWSGAVAISASRAQSPASRRQRVRGRTQLPTRAASTIVVGDRDESVV